MSSAGARLTTTARPGVDPRFRRRRVAVRREQGRRRLRVLVAWLCVLSVCAGSWLLLHSSVFSARRLSVRGEAHTPLSEVLSASGLESHPPLMDVDPGQISRRLEGLPWVRGAVVSVHWPDSVSISITERVPVAIVGARGRYALVDATGRVLGYQGSPGATLPRLLLPAAASEAVGPPGSYLAPAAAPGLAVAGAIPPLLAGKVTSVGVGGAGAVTLSLSDGARALVGPDTFLEEKFEALASVLAGASVPTGSLVDLTVPSEPVVSSQPA